MGNFGFSLRKIGYKNVEYLTRRENFRFRCKARTESGRKYKII